MIARVHHQSVRLLTCMYIFISTKVKIWYKPRRIPIFLNLVSRLLIWASSTHGLLFKSSPEVVCKPVTIPTSSRMGYERFQRLDFSTDLVNSEDEVFYGESVFLVHACVGWFCVLF
jgi:hypothetical protein